jgi:L-aspartate oxidase
MNQNYDFLILGSGIAGLSHALDVADHASVCVVTKRSANDSNTNWAQGGIAAVVDPEDSFEEHIRNTITAGAGLNKREVVELCVREGPAAIARLRERGVQFANDLSREGGHTKRRVLHATDITGREIQRALLEKAQNHPNIDIHEHHTAVDLIRLQKVAKHTHSDRIVGAYILDDDSGKVHSVAAKLVILATGGAGKVYLYTSNPDVATGDGVAMAFRAKAKIANMEFFQFHPTCLYHPRAKTFLISEALRGDGAILRRVDGTPFMDDVHPMGSLAPRDIVARNIDSQMKRTGDDHVVLDLTHLDHSFMEERYPTILGTVEAYGYDWRAQPIPVVPAAHYMCGGVLVDTWGRSSIPGLYAVGEVTCTGLHGANRLASNSLLEGAVFGARAAQKSLEELPDVPKPPALSQWSSGYATPGDERVVISQSWDEIRRFMWNYVGIVRTRKRLDRARRRLDMLRSEIMEDWWRYHVTRDAIELRNIAQVAGLVIEGARRRQESRGLNYNLDFPDRDDELWLRDTILWRGSRR